MGRSTTCRRHQRGLSGKRSLAMREFCLGIEALTRLVKGQPLRLVQVPRSGERSPSALSSSPAIEWPARIGRLIRSRSSTANVLRETIRRISALGHAGRSEPPPRDAIHPIARPEFQRQVVEDMRRVAKPSEQHQRSPRAAPIQHFDLHALFDRDEPNLMRRFVTEPGGMRRGRDNQAGQQG